MSREEQPEHARRPRGLVRAFRSEERFCLIWRAFCSAGCIFGITSALDIRKRRASDSPSLDVIATRKK